MFESLPSLLSLPSSPSLASFAHCLAGKQQARNKHLAETQCHKAKKLPLFAN